MIYNYDFVLASKRVLFLLVLERYICIHIIEFLEIEHNIPQLSGLYPCFIPLVGFCKNCTSKSSALRFLSLPSTYRLGYSIFYKKVVIKSTTFCSQASMQNL